jgi:hypothetical protein
MPRWIVKWAWKEDYTVVSHTVVDAPTEEHVRKWALATQPEHDVLDVELHWQQVVNDLDDELARILLERTGDD